MKAFYSHGSGPWLRYAPHHHFKLPYLVDLERDAQFQNGHSVPAYVLEWPGQVFPRHSEDGGILRSAHPRLTDVLPGDVLEHWTGEERDDVLSLPVDMWLRAGPYPGTPDMWPEGLQYHVAVNHSHYAKVVDPMPKVPVCGLPHEVVQRVLEAELAIDHRYMATIVHLDWLARSLEDDPFLEGGFDTDIRDSLHDIVSVTVRKLFMMIGDCIWSPDERKWSRERFKDLWSQLAAYLWWVGRTGYGLYPSMAGIEPPPGQWDVKVGLPKGTTSLWKMVLEGCIAVDDDLYGSLESYDRYWLEGAALREALRTHRWDYRLPSDPDAGRRTLMVDSPVDLAALVAAGVTGKALTSRELEGEGPHEIPLGEGHPPVCIRIVAPRYGP
jgi:hypothetical protein